MGIDVRKVWMVVLLLVGAAQARATAPAVQDGSPAQVAPIQEGRVWSGRLRDAKEKGGFREVPLSPKLGAELRKELAEIQVSIGVERNFETALAELEGLVIRATRRGYPERRAVVAEMVAARAGVLETLGRREQAAAAASQVLVDSVLAAEHEQYELVAANPEDLDLARQAVASPSLTELRQRLGRSPEAVGSSDKLSDILHKALETGDVSVIDDLGERVAPLLEGEVLKELDNLPNPQVDALLHLMRVSPARGIGLIQANFDRGGSIWKTRVLRAIRQHQKTYGHWTPDARLAPIVRGLLRDPASREDATPLLRWFVGFDTLDGGLQAELTKVLLGSDSQSADVILEALENGSNRLTLRPVLVSALQSPLPKVRMQAAQTLAGYAPLAPLMSQLDHVDPAVRMHLALALKSRSKGSIPPSHTTDPLVATSFESPEAKQALLRLAADPEVEVRLPAVEAMVARPELFDAKVFQSFSSDPDPRIRVAIVSLFDVPLEVRAEIAKVLASDPDPKVLSILDAQFFKLSNSDALDAAYYPALEARRANKHLPFNFINGYRQLMSRNDRGLQAALEWAVKDRDKELAEIVATALVERFEKSPRPWERGTNSLAHWTLTASPEELATLFELSQVNRITAQRLAHGLRQLREDLSGAFLPIARDPARPFDLRIAALDVAAARPGEEASEALVGILKVAKPQDRQGAYAADQVSSIADAFDDSVAASTLRKLLKEPALVAWISPFARGYVRRRTLDPATAKDLLALWSAKADVDPSVVASALKSVANLPKKERGDWIERALHDTRHYGMALQLIGDLRDPDYLPVLEEGMTSGFGLAGFASDPFPVQLAILNALTRYFSEPAAEIILRIAGSTPNSNVREAAFKSLETMRQYKQEKGRWEDERTSKVATATAVRDLLVLLEDSNATVRAQAVRALGTLKAVEQMPRIVRMLKDADAGVRKAAEEALGVLNSTAGK